MKAAKSFQLSEDKLSRLRRIAAKFGQRAVHFEKKGELAKAKQYRAYRGRAFALQNKIRDQLYTQDRAA